jgi:hypothetical protein
MKVHHNVVVFTVDLLIGIQSFFVYSFLAHGLRYDFVVVRKFVGVHIELEIGVFVELGDGENVVLQQFLVLGYFALETILLGVLPLGEHGPALVGDELAVAVLPLGAEVTLDAAVVVVVLTEVAALLTFLAFGAFALAVAA